MAQLVVDETLSGYLRNVGAVYNTIHDAAVGGAFEYQTVVQVSNDYVDPDYYIYRGVAEFDLSALPVGAVISSAIISLYGWSTWVNEPFDIVVVSGADLVEPLQDADYGDLLDEVTSFGSIASGDWVESDYNHITLNPTGKAAIVKEAVNYFAFRCSLDISKTTPSGENGVQWLGAGYGHDAYITINYSTGATFVQTACIG